MTERYVLAAKVQYEDNGQLKTLSVTDDHAVISNQAYNVTENGFVPYVVDGLVYNVAFGGIFADGDWQPRIAADIRWSESARHPYQEQANELRIGDLVLVNDDGGIDFLVTKDVVGFTTELRRGRPDQNWEDFERVFIAKNQSIRMDGRARIIISLNNVLDALFRPVFDEVFDDQTPNPTLRGRQKPFVLGRVKQAPLLDFDPANLTYFGADNVSKVNEVQEGGNPTENWFINDDNLIQLKASPSLDVTADFESDGFAYETVFDGVPTLNDFNAITRSVVGAQATVIEVSDGFELTAGTAAPQLFSSIPQFSAFTSKSSAVTNNLGIVQFFPVGQRRNVWQNPELASVLDPNTFASITIDESLIIDDLVFNIRSTAQTKEQGLSLPLGWPIFFYSISSTNNTQVLKYVDFYKTTENRKDKTPLEQLNSPSAFMFRFVPQRQPVPDQFGVIGPEFFIPEFWNYFDVNDLINQRVEIRVGLDADDGDEIKVFSLEMRFPEAESNFAQIEYKENFNEGELVYVEVQYETIQGNPFLYASGNVNSALTNTSASYYALKAGGYKKEPSGVIKTMVLIPPEGFFANNKRVKITCDSPSLNGGPDFSAGTIKITNVKIKRGVTASPSYKDLVPYLLLTCGISPTVSLDQQMINDHADALGDPDMGWLINGSESVDEILFKLSGSLFGYVWYGLDGKIRSKLLEPPTEPTGNFLTIDEGRADPINVVTYNDIPPRLTKKIKALRNWRPIDNDRQAGIIQSWTSEDRALVSRDYRITKKWSFPEEFKDSFNRLYPQAAKQEPYETALLDEAPAQIVAQRSGNTWFQRPRFYEVDCFVRLGELHLIEVGKTVKVKLDYPSLEDANLLVLGREGDSRTGFVRLTLWGFTQETFQTDSEEPPIFGNLITSQSHVNYNGIGNNGTFTASGPLDNTFIELENGGLVIASLVFSFGNINIYNFIVSQSGDRVPLGVPIDNVSGVSFTLTPNKNNLTNQGFFS